MNFPFQPPVEPMLASPADEIPVGDGWRYEPKWDGFRAIVFKDGQEVVINSRKGQPLQRYFPELVELFQQRLPDRCVVDGEMIIAGPKGLEFDSLQLRLHPAASRVNKLSKEIPAQFVAFDILYEGQDDLREKPLTERRARLERAVSSDEGSMFLTPHSAKAEDARDWFQRFEGAGLDGIIAKRAELPYVFGERVMVKVKHHRTADCVVGGYREYKHGGVGSLLLGLYDEGGVFHHVGHTSSFKVKERKELVAKLQPYVIEQPGADGGFGEGRTPGAPSRWSAGKDLSWIPMRPELVVEVEFDYMQGDRFRHGATFVRWRTDKAPRQCTYDQLAPPHPFSLEEIRKRARGA